MNSGFNYLATQYLGGTERIKLYYEFNTGSTFVHQELVGVDTMYTGAVFNHAPDYSGDLNLLLKNITGSDVADTPADILEDVTGSFLVGDEFGDLTYSCAQITGVPDVNFNDCTFLFSTEKIRPKAGLIFGSLNKTTGEVNSTYYEYAEGYNIGINARNQLFFQGLGPQGPYVLTANEFELANKNIYSVSVGYGVVDFSLYDPASDSSQTQRFDLDTQYINNPTGSLSVSCGDRVEYIHDGQTFSGYIGHFALISGNVSDVICKTLSSGFYSDLVYQSGEVTEVIDITGKTTELLYATGVTGVEVKVTGSFLDKTSGVLKQFGSTEVTSGSLKEGSLYYSGLEISNGFADTFLEREGVVIDDMLYVTSGDAAADTLGLSSSTLSVDTSSHSITFSSPDTTGIMQIFPSGITGLLYDQPTGKSEVDLTNNYFITGEATNQLIPNTDKVLGYKHDLIYFLGDRA